MPRGLYERGKEIVSALIRAHAGSPARTPTPRGFSKSSRNVGIRPSISNHNKRLQTNNTMCVNHQYMLSNLNR